MARALNMVNIYIQHMKYHVYVGLARTVHIHRIRPYVWWFPCQKYRTCTVYIWFWPTLCVCFGQPVLASLKFGTPLYSSSFCFIVSTIGESLQDALKGQILCFAKQLNQGLQAHKKKQKETGYQHKGDAVSRLCCMRINSTRRVKRIRDINTKVMQ